MIVDVWDSTIRLCSGQYMWYAYTTYSGGGAHKSPSRVCNLVLL